MPERWGPEVDRLRTVLRAVEPSSRLTVLERELETFTVAALAADDSSRYVAVNTLACELTGFSAAELCRLSVMDLTPPRGFAEGRQLWNEFVEHGTQHGEYELVARSGALVHVRYWAFSEIAPGIHLSLMMRVAGS